MPIFKFPYTDFQQKNLDWIIDTINDDKERTDQAMDDIAEAITNAETATENANTATENTNTAISNAQTATTAANNAKDAANTAAANAQAAADKWATPYASTTVAGMTDHAKIYVYTGSEVGYTRGNWYYWNGTAWTSGGIYTGDISDAVLFSTAQSKTDAEKAQAQSNMGILDKVNISIDLDSVTTTGNSVIASVTGTAVGGQAAKFSVSDFVDISAIAGMTAVVHSIFDSWFGLAFYQKNKTFISGYNSTTASVTPNAVSAFKTTIPVNAAYIRFTLTSDFSTDPEDYPVISDESLLNVLDAFITSYDKDVAENDFSTLSVFEHIGVCGDSFASGQITENGNTAMYYNLSWPQILGRSCGVNVYNYAVSGYSTKTFLTGASRALPALLADDPKDLYIMAFGLNDISISDYLGTIDDITNDYTENPDTFYGNYARIIEQVQAHAPNAKIVLSTMARYFTQPQYRAFDTAIIEIAAHYNIPVLITTDDPFFASNHFQDGLVNYHPTAILYGGMAKAYERLFNRSTVKYASYYADFVTT